MAATGPRLGIKGVIQYNATFPETGGAWATLKGVEDATLVLEDEDVELNVRDMAGFKSSFKGLRDWSVEFDLLWDPLEAGFTAIRDAYLNAAATEAAACIGLRILDGIVAGDQGVEGPYNIMKFTRGEPRGDMMVVSVVAKPARVRKVDGSLAGPPTWYTVP